MAFGALHLISAFYQGGITMDLAHCTSALIALVLMIVTSCFPFIVKYISSYLFQPIPMWKAQLKL